MTRNVDLHAVVVLPPPWTGATIATDRFLGELRDRHVSVAEHGISRAPGDGYWRWRVRKYVALRRAFGSEQVSMYMVPDAHIGFLLSVDRVARALRSLPRVLFHHHVSRYLKGLPWPTRRWVFSHPSSRHIVLSRGMKRDLLAQYEIDADRVFVVPNTYAVDNPAPRVRRPKPDGGLRIGFASNLGIEKGLDTVLALAGRLDGLRSIEIVGDLDEHSSRLIHAATDRTAVPIKHSGFVPRQEMASFWNSIDIFTLPSRYVNEAQPLVVLEAMARGIVTITSDVGYLSDVVPESHRLAAGFDADALAERIEEVRDHLLAHGEAAKRRFRELEEEADRGLTLVAEELRSNRAGS